VGQRSQAEDDEKGSQPLRQKSDQEKKLNGGNRIEHGTHRWQKAQLLELFIANTCIKDACIRTIVIFPNNWG
jgi:hypothetical protein